MGFAEGNPQRAIFNYPTNIVVLVQYAALAQDQRHQALLVDDRRISDDADERGHRSLQILRHVAPIPVIAQQVVEEADCGVRHGLVVARLQGLRAKLDQLLRLVWVRHNFAACLRLVEVG